MPHEDNEALGAAVREVVGWAAPEQLEYYATNYLHIHRHSPTPMSTLMAGKVFEKLLCAIADRFRVERR